MRSEHYCSMKELSLRNSVMNWMQCLSVLGALQGQHLLTGLHAAPRLRDKYHDRMWIAVLPQDQNQSTVSRTLRERGRAREPLYRYVHAIKRSCFSRMPRWCKDGLSRDRPVDGTVMSDAAGATSRPRRWMLSKASISVRKFFWKLAKGAARGLATGRRDGLSHFWS